MGHLTQHALPAVLGFWLRKGDKIGTLSFTCPFVLKPQLPFLDTPWKTVSHPSSKLHPHCARGKLFLLKTLRR